MIRSAKPKLVVYGFTSSLSVRFCEGHAAQLRAHGMEVVVISSPGPELDKIGLREKVGTLPVPMEREISPLSDLFSLYKILRILRRLRPMITNFGTPKAGLLGGIAARLAGVPCRIYTIHGLRLETAREIKRRLLELTETIACACAHRVICVSSSLRERAIHLRLVNRERCVVLLNGTCNGVITDRDAGSVTGSLDPAALKATLRLPANVPVIGFVGRLTRDKGLPELIAAYEILKKRTGDVRLLLVGDFETGDPVPDELRKKIDEDNNLVQTGFVDDPTPYYEVMDVLALPTYREGFPDDSPRSRRRWQTGGHNRRYRRDRFGDSRRHRLRCAERRPGSVAQALDTVLSEPALARRMGIAGRERVLRDFRREEIVEALADMYTGTVINGQSTATPKPAGAPY